MRKIDFLKKVSLEKRAIFLAEQGCFWGLELGSSLRLTSTVLSLQSNSQPPGFLGLDLSLIGFPEKL